MTTKGSEFGDGMSCRWPSGGAGGRESSASPRRAPAGNLLLLSKRGLGSVDRVVVSHDFTSMPSCDSLADDLRRNFAEPEAGQTMGSDQLTKGTVDK